MTAPVLTLTLDEVVADVVRLATEMPDEIRDGIRPDGTSDCRYFDPGPDGGVIPFCAVGQIIAWHDPDGQVSDRVYRTYNGSSVSELVTWGVLDLGSADACTTKRLLTQVQICGDRGETWRVSAQRAIKAVLQHVGTTGPEQLRIRAGRAGVADLLAADGQDQT
jgi:hypothetical protein